MRDVSTEIKVGMVVIAAIVILLYGIIWVKGYQFTVGHYEYTALFPQVGNLSIGDPVTVLGVRKGDVKAIKLSDDRVSVTISLASDVKLKTDASVAVVNVGLMGERYVEVNPGKAGQPLDLKQPIHGIYDTGIPEVMAMMGDVLGQVKRLVDVLEGTFGETGKAEDIRQIIDNLQALTSQANAFMQDNQAKLSKSAENLSLVAESLHVFFDSNSVELNETVQNFAEASQNLKELSAQVHVLTTKISEGQGTLGKVVADDSLYNDLRQTLINLDSLITDFKEHPKKYVKVSVF